MKVLITSFITLSTLINFAQVKLDPKDLKNLILISELYSKNTNAKGPEFAKSIDSLRTPILNHISDALIEVGKGEKTILTNKYLKRPDNEELYLWFVIREIHYNLVSKTKTKRPNLEVANEILAQNIDERWLLDNYYYRIHRGIAFLFNDTDLSKIDIDVEKLGFKNRTEKSIFYFNMMDALIGGRFKVLQMLKKNDKILEYSDKLPTFNGKKYFYYTDLDFEDFDWIGYEEKKSYSDVNIGNLYLIVIAQFNATSQLKSKSDSQEIYLNSILHEPKYFKFSNVKEDLQILFEKSK
ncbi:hypothetical protein [Flavobacterium sp.]|uniref:hypothetical protein n=1 Tax=Flavobacterium sp. TaxID=239 RepID=UPI00262FC5F4|nr:hypothetical protein [Flavobacterium sp.]